METMTYDILYKCLQGCMAITPKADVRYYLNGVHIRQARDGVTIEASDGCRAVRFVYSGQFSRVDTLDVILTRNGVDVLLRFLKMSGLHKDASAEVAITSVTGLEVVFGVQSVPIIDGRFPDVSRVIWLDDPEAISEIGLDARYLADILKITKPFRGNKQNPVKLEFKDSNAATRITFNTGVSGLSAISLLMPCRLYHYDNDIHDTLHQRG